jgi:hypothetical protein
MRTKQLLATGIIAVLTTTAVHADTFGNGPNTFTIDFVTIGNPGNPADTGTTRTYGAVGSPFRMGKYEISEDMITKANTLGGLLISKDTRGVNVAATSVSWNEAARFVNWLNTSSGYSPAYKFAMQPGGGGYTGNESLVLWTASDSGYDAGNLYRNANAHYFLPSENEWYKAAFYSGSGTTYYDFATGSNTEPTMVVSGTLSGTAVFGGQAGPATITQAGGLSPYGTMGQGGNVWEWNESAFDGLNSSSSENRGFRGGSFNDTASFLDSFFRLDAPPAYSDSNVGFRVASVPEPSSTVLMIGTWLIFLARRHRARSL